ncbi:MAG: c-type cytochrome [Deltaproteobacteria bacterium]
MIQTHARLVLSLFAAGAFACGGGDEEESQPIDYYQGATSAALGAAGNQADCATCHSNDGSKRSGDSLKDIAYRTSFKGGDAPNLLAGSNACVTGWMGGTALAETDEAWIMLETYLQSISSESVTDPNPLMPEVLDNEAAYEAAYGGGDATAGAAKYTAACGTCHDANLKVGPAGSLAKATLGTYTVGRIAQKVRTSGPPPSGMMDASDSTPGPMPFFEPADLSQQDLADIIAHLLQ